MNAEERTEWRVAFFAFAVGFPIFLAFVAEGNLARGRAAMLAAGAIICAASGFWDERRKWWYWCSLFVVTIIHGLIVLKFSWSDRPLNYWQLLPFGFADALVVFVFLKIVQWIAKKRNVS